MTTVLDWACPGNLKVLGTINVVGGFVGPATFTRLIATDVTNQIELGTGNTTIINSPAPAADRIYTLLDAGANANFVATEGNFIINSNTTIASSIQFGGTNTRIGDNAGTSLTGLAFFNTAIGFDALTTDTNGQFSVAVGYQALRNSLLPAFNKGNTAVGSGAGVNLTNGRENIFIGPSAGPSIFGGTNNVFIGNSAGNGLNTGNDNIFIGDGNAFVIGNYTNSISIGDAASGNNYIRMGNAAITNADIEVAWTVVSDKNQKKQIEPANLGVGFIEKLQPRKYLLKTEPDDTPQKRYGLIAQEVEETLNSLNITDFGAVRNTNDVYSLRYDDLFACLVKAIQEIYAEIKAI